LLKRQLGPCVTFFPQPTTLIATQNGEGEVNLMMASWVGIVSKTPPTIAVSSGTFSVNVVPSRMAQAADACGLASGKKVDKQKLTALEVSPGTLEGVSLVDESPLNVECRYVNEVELGDYRLVLGEIVEIHACEAAFNAQGEADVKVFDPLVYLGGMREYWSLGKKEAEAYRAGLILSKSH
jgi:flavin reductase (DIM6/NTAB) family NADH-FMN oxidoreductase RutF